MCISTLSLCLEAADAENASSSEEGESLRNFFVVRLLSTTSYVCVYDEWELPSLYIGSECEEDDKECLKKLIQKVCMHTCLHTMYVCIYIYTYPCT